MEQSIFEERKQAFQHFKYLPLFYMIPYEIALKRGLVGFPRDPYVVATSEKWREVYFSKYFQVMLLDTWGWMMWQSLGIRGGIESYSKNDPFVLMAFSLPMWAALLAELGINIDLLSAQQLNTEIPFLNMELAAHNCDQFAKLFWEHPKLKMREVLEIVEKHRSHADYSSRNSHIKVDFHRQYYHTRAQTKVIPIIDENDEVIEVSHASNEFAEVENRLWLENFLSRLEEKDRKIIRFLENGYTQVEVAKMLGYANHSGVCKRIKHIGKQFLKFKQEERDFESKYQ